MNNSKKSFPQKRIGIVAYDNERSGLIEWAYLNKEILNEHEVIANGATANLLEGTIGTAVITLPAGEFGGYYRLAELIEANAVDLLFFFGDPRGASKQLSGIMDLLPLATAMDIPISCNNVSADIMLKSLKGPLSSKANYNDADFNPGATGILQSIGTRLLKIASIVF